MSAAARPAWECLYCGRKFRSLAGVKQHEQAKHPRAEKDEPSIADLMVQAELDRAMGEPVEDWLADMLP